jgi:hypothetical protein
VDDGRYANNGWMQELPDPITKMTWDNAVLISRKTARELGVANGDIVEITLNGRKQSPARSGPQPGMADYSLGLALGYGREKAGRVGTGVGFNAYKIFSGKYIETGATIRKTGETHIWPARRIIGPWKAVRRCARRIWRNFTKEPNFAKENFTASNRRSSSRFIRIRSTRRRRRRLHQWGMTVDLNRASAAAPAWSPARARTTFPLSARTRCDAAARCTGCGLTVITRPIPSGKQSEHF